MCETNSIKLYMRGLHMFKSLSALYMIVAGCVLVADVQAHVGFGSDILAVGVVVLFLGVLKPCSICMGHYGSVTHNKCALLTVIGADAAIGVVQFSVGLTLLVRSTHEFEPDLRNKCSRSSQTEEYSFAECDEFWAHDRTAGMRLAWESLFYMGVRDKQADKRKLITELQNTGKCCGFGPPLACGRIANSDKFPAHLFQDDYLGKDMLRRRVTCSEDTDGTGVCAGTNINNCWYPAEDGMCAHYADSDISASTPLGCKYDWPIGTCMDFAPTGSSSGCAGTFETWMNAKIFPHGAALLGTLCLETLTILAACCFCWKRKSHDVLPIAYVYDEPWDPVKEGKLSAKPQDGVDTTLHAETAT